MAWLCRGVLLTSGGAVWAQVVELLATELAAEPIFRQAVRNLFYRWVGAKPSLGLGRHLHGALIRLLSDNGRQQPWLAGDAAALGMPLAPGVSAHSLVPGAWGWPAGLPR
jgi:hypothetical protein